MFNIWQDRGLFSVSEQRLADQVKKINEKCWLPAAEVEELSQQITIGTYEVGEEVVTSRRSQESRSSERKYRRETSNYSSGNRVFCGRKGNDKDN